MIFRLLPTSRLLFLLALIAGQRSNACAQTSSAESGSGTNVWNLELAEKASLLFQQLPAPARHYAGLGEAEANRLLQSDVNYRKFMREKLQRKWFAALVAWEGAAPYSIVTRFETWRELVEFLAEKNALVDVWAYGEAGEHEARRIPAPELAQLKHQVQEQPTFLTVTFRDDASGQAMSYHLEFGFHAAETVWASERAYQRHRSLQLTAREILAAKNTKGLPDSLAQWTALQNQVRQHQLPLLEMPTLPTDPKDIFVAFEFEVDDESNYAKVARVYRNSEVQKKVIADGQVLFLRKAGEQSARQVLGFGRLGLNGALQPVPNPILGQDVVELRIKDSTQPDTNKWHVLEFGEPEVLKQSALAHFAQLNAYLERKRKARAMQQANLALVAEPIIAGLNIGGGLAGLGFPAGESVRLLYNLITWRLISAVPTARQMRELFALMAARDRDPTIKLKPEGFLTKTDIQTLKEAGSKLTDQEIQTYLELMSDEDVRAMLRLAQQGMIDARVTTFLNTLASVFKVSGVSEHPGVIRDIFNNVRFSVNGDINISTLLLLALGKSEMTALSGVSLEELSHGNGPPEAWLQYLVVSVDIRAILNTIVRLTKTTLAKKELEKPFPYAPRMSELAAYEVRIFGFPLLMFYKRGLIAADREAYEHDYAYGLYGVRLAEHFRSREEMEAEIRAGRMFPLGLVKVPSAAGGWRETDLVVYAHRVPTGKFRGKTALVIYGLKAYSEYSELIGRELIRFKEFEKGLHEGAVIEQRIWQEASSPSPSASYEPVIQVGPNAIQETFAPLLGNLLELRRHSRLTSWGLPAEETEFTQAKERLAASGIQPAEGDPLVEIDAHNSSFIYRRQLGGQAQLIKVTGIPSLTDIDREMRKAEEGKSIEEIRAEAAAGKSMGVVLLNEALLVRGHLELGPLLRDPQVQVVGAGVTSGAKATEEIFELIGRLPVTDRVRLHANHFAATAVELDGEGRGNQKVFLTIEFPIGEVRQDKQNAITGERETLVYSEGLWRKSITDRRILELAYDADQIEIGSRTYENRGTREKPVRGVLLEETKTLDYWFRDLRQPSLDPYQPTIAKLHVNYVTGEMSRETYGLFVLPVETVDDQYVTSNRYTSYGLLESATVFENGREESDFSRPATAKVLEPVLGRARFHLTPRVDQETALPGVSNAGRPKLVERTDLIKGRLTTESFDTAHFGRKVRQDRLDTFDGTRSFSSIVTWDYRDDFHFGLVPVGSVTTSSPSGTPLVEATTLSYDPVRRRLTGTEVSYTGKTQTNIWDYRWEAPVEVETTHRRIIQDYNREETLSHSTTIVKGSAELIQQTSGQYDATNRTWLVNRLAWYRPGVLAQTETNIYSAFGLLISSRAGNAFEMRPSYTSDGIEIATLTFQRSVVTGRYDVLTRQQDDYHWQNGGCNARVQIYADGLLADEYRATTDEEGRIIEDGVRT